MKGGDWGASNPNNPFGPPEPSTNPFGSDSNRPSSPRLEFKRPLPTSLSLMLPLMLHPEVTKVDTQSTKEALRLAQESLQIGSGTLQTLAVQAEQLDRIENTVEMMHAKLDKTDRLLRGIESLPAYIGQAMKKAKPRRVKWIQADRSVPL